MIQAAERRKRAVVVAAGLQKQRASSWEQLWDDKGGRFYFYYKVHKYFFLCVCDACYGRGAPRFFLRFPLFWSLKPQPKTDF